MPPTPNHRECPPGRSGAAGRIASAMAAALAVVAIGPAAGVATAQAPGLESFARPPETPLELWDAISYLTRVGLTDQALPLLDRFLDAEPDDATLLEIRDRFGIGSVLRLQDDPRTAGRVREILDRLNAASRRDARREDRLRRSIGLLTGSPLQQSEALLRLNEAGPHAVPYLLEAIVAQDPGTPDRALLVANLGRLDRGAVPALIAALDAPDPALAADVASALGRIGDRRALPFLVSEATTTDPDREPVRPEAATAILRLTGAPLEDLPRPPARMLLDEARRYLTGAYTFPGDQVELWSWSDGTVVPQLVRPNEAEIRLGRRFATRALELAPEDREPEAVLVALQAREAVLLVGPDALPPTSTLPGELAVRLLEAGPEAMADALALSLEAGLDDEAALLVAVLGSTADATAFSADPPSPLVAALASPDRRVQLAAARTIADLNPDVGFPGASRVVPILSRSLDLGPVPEVVVVSGSSSLLTTLAATVQAIGLSPITAETAAEGFRRAAGSANVEAVIIDPALIRGPRDARDLLIDLRADARTAGIPALLVLPIAPSAAIARGEMTRLPQAELEPNDVPARATPLVLTGSPRRARIDGRLSPDDRPPFGQEPLSLPEPEEDLGPVDLDDQIAAMRDAPEPPPPAPDISGDLFALGPLRPGDSVSAIIEPSAGSTLRPEDVMLWLQRREGPSGIPVAQGVGSLAITIDVPGVYDLRVQAAQPYLYSYRALYALDVAVSGYDQPVQAVIVGSTRLKLEQMARRFDAVEILTDPASPSLTLAELDRAWEAAGRRILSPADRAAFGASAAEALARIAGRDDSPLLPDLAHAVGPLRRSLDNPGLVPDAAKALSAVPTVEAQRVLADLVTDGSRPSASRSAGAAALAESIRRFGPLLAPDQRPALLRARDRAAEPDLRAAIGAVFDALRPAPPPGNTRPGLRPVSSAPPAQD